MLSYSQWCRPESTENVEHAASDQEPVAIESNRAAEHAKHAGSTKQHSIDQHTKGSVPNANMPDVASGGTMGVVLSVGTDNDDPTAERDVLEVVAIEEEPKIEEIIWAPKETMQLQCIRVARKHHDEWVFHEEEHSDRALCKLQHTVDDLMCQIKVKPPETLSCVDESFVVL
jgi:hypothetical protein